MDSRRPAFYVAIMILVLSGLTPQDSYAQTRETKRVDSRQPMIQAGEIPEISGGAAMNMLRNQAFVPGGQKSFQSFPTPTPLVPAAPILASSFEAVDFNSDGTNNGGFFHIPPDPIGAAGPSHLVCVVNCSIERYLKTGALLSSTSLGSFFSSLSPLTQTFDPKVIYDQYASRFVVVTLEQTDVANGDPANTSRIFVAVSATSDPTGTWYFTQINSKVNISTVDRWADYPGFAVDDKAVYITANMFGFGASGAFGGVRLWIINKGVVGGFYAGAAASVGIYDPYATGSPTTTQPAHMFGTPPGTMGTFLVSYSGLTDGVNEYLQFVRVDNPLTVPIFTQSYLSLGSLEANPMPGLPDAPQLGTSTLVEVNDRRALNAVWRGNQLYITTTILPPSGTDAGQTTAHWFNVNTTTLSALTLTDQGNIGGEDIATGTYTSFPSIAVDASGNLAIGFAASAPTIYPGAYFTGRFATDPAGTNRGSGVLRAGLDFYIRTFGGGRNRWGDYTGTCVDPSGSSFWFFNEFAKVRGTIISGEDGRWRTAFGNLAASALPIQLAALLGTVTQNGHAMLQWETISEIDNLGFEVQKSPNPATGYVTVPNSFIPGHGTTNVRQQYSFTDASATPGSWYYRLKQTDLDGTIHHSQAVQLEITTAGSMVQIPATFSLSQNFPNPFNPSTEIRYELPEESHVRLRLFNSLGQEVRTLVDANASAGTHTVKLDASQLASGIYIYKMEAGRHAAIRTMMVIR